MTSMFFMAEFELFESEGAILALPFGLEGGTEDPTTEEAAAMAADWLRGEVEHWLMTGTRLPSPPLGNVPLRGGRVCIVGVSCSLEAIDTMTASEAAQALGVSRPRISQMIKSGRLEGFTRGHATFVTTASVRARLAEPPRPGRPRRQPEPLHA